MKRLISTLLFLSLSAFVFGQSITLLPSTMQKSYEGVGDDLLLTKYSFNESPFIIGRNANGTSTSPAATSIFASLLFMGGRGHTGSGFTNASSSSMRFEASETWTTSATGSSIIFRTTQNGTTFRNDRMTIYHNGNVGIGTTSPDAKLEVAGTYAVSGKTTFTGTQHNYNLGGKSVIHVNGGNSLLTGIAGGSDGMIVHIYVGINTDLTIADQSTLSLAANRIVTGHSGDMTIIQGGGATLIYDGDVSSWRVIGWKP